MRGACAAAALLVLLGFGGRGHAVARANPIQAKNAIQTENAKPGTAQWRYPLAYGRGVEAYASETSVSPGGELDIHVSTASAARYRLEVYRLGWYGGQGGRLVACVPTCTGDEQGQEEPLPSPDPATGIIRANWPVTDRVTVGGEWTSGYYIADAVLTTGPQAGNATPIFFVVREPASESSAILVVAPVNTWEAYNGWGGKSLYPYNSTHGVPATTVSFDRPFGGGWDNQMPFDWEYQLVRFLERNGYDVSYATDVDIDTNPSELLQHRLVIVNGHDEYWSGAMRSAYDAAVAEGTNMAFVGADIGDWQIRYEDGDRTIVEYRQASLDPVSDAVAKTVRFRDVGRPQCSLLGVQYQQGFTGSYPAPSAYTVADASDPWFLNTGLVQGSQLPGTVGYEWDGAQAHCQTAPLTVLFRALGPPEADAVRYTAPSGARVFSTGSLQFVWALDGYEGHDSVVNSGAEQFMRNALTDLLRPAAPTTATAVPARLGVAITVSPSPDPRVRTIMVLGHKGTAAFVPGRAGVFTACSSRSGACLDRALNPGTLYRFEAVAVDRWGMSAPALTAPILAPRPSP